MEVIPNFQLLPLPVAAGEGLAHLMALLVVLVGEPEHLELGLKQAALEILLAFLHLKVTQAVKAMEIVQAAAGVVLLL